MAVVPDSVQRMLDQLASITGTDAQDWFATFKARHAMQVTLDAAAKATGRTKVATQLFTCVTAVDPIVASGLEASYVDISPDTLAIDPVLFAPDEQTCAVVAQHTFGIIDDAAVAALGDKAREAGALLVEDSAHCVGRMARDAAGRPLADLSYHSFGVEKMLPGVYFGGAVWVSPDLDEHVREPIRAALSALPELPRSLERATRHYRNQMRVFTRVPHGLSVALRGHSARRGSFEPAVSEDEQRGRVSHEACLPSPWIAEQATAGMDGLGENERRRRACVAAYHEAFARVPEGDAWLFIPAAVRGVAADEPLLRYPVFFRTPELAERAIAAVSAQGHYAQSWPRPLLLPGVLDPAAYGLAKGTSAWPVSERLSAGVVALPTDIDPAAVADVAEAMIDLSRQ